MKADDPTRMRRTQWREDVIREMQAIAEVLDQRIDIWRIIIATDGTVSRRIYRGSFSVSHSRITEARLT